MQERNPACCATRRPEDGARGSPAARRGDRLRRGRFTTWLFRWGQHGNRRKGRAARERGPTETRLDFRPSLMDKYQQKIERGRREGNVAPPKLESPKRSSGRTVPYSTLAADLKPVHPPLRRRSTRRLQLFFCAREVFSAMCEDSWRSGWAPSLATSPMRQAGGSASAWSPFSGRPPARRFRRLAATNQ